MFKYLVHDIDWDTDGEEVDLPKEIEIQSETELDDERVSEEITVMTGYCHKGFCWDEIKESGRPTLRATIEVDKKTLDYCEKLLNSTGVDFDKEKIPELSTLDVWTARFEDGFEFDIKFNSNEREDGDFFSEGVLFDPKGNQIDFTACECDLRGEWRLSSRDKDYIVNIVDKPVDWPGVERKTLRELRRGKRSQG